MNNLIKWLKTNNIKHIIDGRVIEVKIKKDIHINKYNEEIEFLHKIRISKDRTGYIIGHTYDISVCKAYNAKTQKEVKEIINNVLKHIDK